MSERKATQRDKSKDKICMFKRRMNMNKEYTKR